MGIIYKITSPSNKVYVGKTYDLRKRINAYKCAVKYNKNIIFHNSIRKHGWDAHILEVIEEVEDSLMDEREMFWIKELNTYCYVNPMGLNMTKGGDGQRSTWMHDIERRKWYSEKFKGKGNPFYNKKHTEEARKILSEKTREWNLNNKIKVPEWGVKKGRLKVIKAIICYDKNGDFIAEYVSLAEASQKLNIHHSSISESCNGKITGVEGKYVFRYKTKNYPLKIEVDEIKKKTEKRPVLYIQGRKIIEYPSALEASVDLGVPKTSINRAAMYNNLKPLRSGHVFIYKDLYRGKKAS